MARSYSRDGSGRFAGGSQRGDRAETVQQNRAEKTAERKAAREALSGGKLGIGRKRRVNRNATIGKRATTKAGLRAAQASKRRFT
jgi:hypothetical protein